MKKFISIIGIIITFFIIYFLQVNFFNWFNIAGIKPNLFVMLILFIGLFAGKKYGIVFGFLLGIYLDLLVAKTVGFSGILYAIVGFLAGYFEKTFSKDSKITIILMVIGSTVFYEVLFYLYNILKFSGTLEILIFLKILLIELLFNSLITIIIYPLIQKFGYAIENVFKESKLLTRYF